MPDRKSVVDISAHALNNDFFLSYDKKVEIN